MRCFKTKCLFWLTLLVICFIGQTSILAYTVYGHAQCNAGWAPYGAIVRVFEVDPSLGGGYTVDEIPLPTPPVIDEHGDFIVTTASPYGGGGFEVGPPDLIFQFVQNVNSAVETIYEEEPSETHWNVTDGSTLNFHVTSGVAVCFDPTIGTSPNHKLFLFTRVGKYETACIDCRGSDPASEGYHCSRRLNHHTSSDCPECSGMDTDRPFGRTLDLFGWFGQQCNIDYYKVQYSTDGGGTWTDIKTDLPNKWYDTSDPYSLNWHWESESMGPTDFGGEVNLYKIPYKVRPGVPWSFPNRVAKFDTKLVTDGLCRLKVLGYKRSGDTLVDATSSDWLVDDHYGQIVLQVDNTPPSVAILDLTLNGDSKPPCEILSFGAGDTISVQCRIRDENGHLREYGLEAMYGHNQKVTPLLPGADDNYGYHSAGSPSWKGSLSHTISYSGSIYDPDKMPTCAYQFRLHASKRTTDGYDLIYHWVEDTWHVTIQR